MALELRDPIHKRIKFDEFERSVIDHPFFQRLRFISQLSFLQSYVYPGALHNRFTHCLGAMHIAGRLFGRTIQKSEIIHENLDKEEIAGLRKRVRLAGLLHDIGHGPFSHASESVFPDFKDLPLNKDWWKKEKKRQAVHEDYSVLLIQTLADEGVLEMDLAQDICSLIHASVKPSSWLQELDERLPSLHKVLKSLISGEVDCDRMDYLLRDSYYCGVAYGQYDIDWLISSMSLQQHKDRLVIAVSENGVRAFEDLLLARYHMIDQVYFHKTKAGFIHYLAQAIQEKEIELEIPTDPYAYADLRDGKVIEMMVEAGKSPENYWSHHLMRRITAKRILRFHKASKKDERELKKLQKHCEKIEVRWFTHSVKNTLTQLGEIKSKEQVIVVWKRTVSGHELIPMYEYSDLLQNYNEKLQFTDFFVLREDVKKYESEKPSA